MNKQFLGIIIAVLVGLFGIFALTNKDDNGGEGGGGSAASASEHVKGKTDSNVTLIEYGDFQCPACRSFFPIIEQLESEYGDRVKFQFRHYPLTSIHPNAFLGSRAAEAAGKQNKFFEMHDLLYQNQDSWAQSQDPTSIFEGYASQLELNLEQFRTDMKSAEVADVINADIKAGQAVKANSTPTFVLNGTKLDKNPTSLDEFKKLLDDELAENQ